MSDDRDVRHLLPPDCGCLPPSEMASSIDGVGHVISDEFASMLRHAGLCPHAARNAAMTVITAVLAATAVIEITDGETDELTDEGARRYALDVLLPLVDEHARWRLSGDYARWVAAQTGNSR
jgi:hypothetical protein